MLSHSIGLTWRNRESSMPWRSGSGRANDARHVPGLPIDDARHDQGEAATAIHLLPEIAGVDTTPVPVEHVARKRVHLLDLQELQWRCRVKRKRALLGSNPAEG